MRFLCTELPPIASKTALLFPEIVPAEFKPAGVRLLEQLREQARHVDAAAAMVPEAAQGTLGGFGGARQGAAKPATDGLCASEQGKRQAEQEAGPKKRAKLATTGEEAASASLSTLFQRSASDTRPPWPENKPEDAGAPVAPPPVVPAAPPPVKGLSKFFGRPVASAAVAAPAFQDSSCPVAAASVAAPPLEDFSRPAAATLTAVEQLKSMEDQADAVAETLPATEPLIQDAGIDVEDKAVPVDELPISSPVAMGAAVPI
eukprot:NODE_6738_length_1643_cov_4.160950.p1 GENE.NODE_6738_length_1643_cov_4.160950~~NODE_6738_length_1643_cov_4.160950.p1  ORF type:complete len:279 (+),score=72.27 NODE_6738_length_1643_cov_4.160950:59-838(+)